jgi:hypothetical protein
VVAFQRVRADERESVGLHHGARPQRTFGRGAIPATAIAVPGGGVFGGDDGFDGDGDGRGVLGVEFRRQHHHPRPVLTDVQGPPCSQLLFSGCDTVGIEVRLRAGEDLGELLSGQPRGLGGESTFRFGDPLCSGPARHPIEHRDDRRCCGRPDPAGPHFCADVGVAGGGVLAGERHPGCRGLADLHQPDCFAGAGAHRRREQHRGGAVPLLPGEAVAPQLGPRLPRDLSGDDGGRGIQQPTRDTESVVQAGQRTGRDAVEHVTRPQ